MCNHLYLAYTYSILVCHHSSGAIQLSWNYNYIDASKELTGSASTLCDNPELVATNPTCKRIGLHRSDLIEYFKSQT
jgi:hypothetical protein